jgi:16S rRNA G966 N2-methylase RsmD
MNTKEKLLISKHIYNININDIIDDFEKLRNTDCKLLNLGSHIGDKIVNYFTAHERLNTLGRKGISFFDIYNNRKELIKKAYIKKLLDYHLENNQSIYRAWHRVSNLYFSSISIFKPIIAKSIYCKFNPTSILDFTMGWGGRMVGACSLDIQNYIGIDLNKKLKKPLTNMSKFLNDYSKTNIKLIFKDALLVDYKKLYYDFVLTSPPYYNIELYSGTKKRTIEEWNKNFYEPLFYKTFDGLQKDGIYCLNIPDDVYKNVCLKLFGKYNKRIEMYKTKRNDPNQNNEIKKEYIYIWYK